MPSLRVSPVRTVDGRARVMKRPQHISLTTLYRELVDGLPLGAAVIHIGDPEDTLAWKLVAANKLATQLVGSSLFDFLNLPCGNAGPQSIPGKLKDFLGKSIARGRVGTLGQIRNGGRDGARTVHKVRACSLPGNCVGVLFEDVSRLNLAAGELVEAETLLAHMTEAAGAILWRADPHTLKFNFVTPSAKEILGYWTERWCGETNFWKNHVHSDDWEDVQRHCAATVLDGAKTKFDCRMYSAEGGLHWFRVYVQKTQRPFQRIELSGVMVDVTDQKRTERTARRLSAKLMQTQEQERKRISRDLHDSVGQYLTGLRMRLAELRNQNDCRGEVQEKLLECAELVQSCIEQVRSVSYNLYPPEVEMMGLIPALRSYARNFSAHSSIRVETDLPETRERLEPDAEIALFRIAQESLTNIQRHARCEAARLRVHLDDGNVTLEIGDTGVGIEPGMLKRLVHGLERHGLGLLKMRERVHDLGGKLEIESNGHGTLVRVRIPRHGGASDEQGEGRQGTGMLRKEAPRKASAAPKAG